MIDPRKFTKFEAYKRFAEAWKTGSVEDVEFWGRIAALHHIHYLTTKFLKSYKRGKQRD